MIEQIVKAVNTASKLHKELFLKGYMVNIEAVASTKKEEISIGHTRYSGEIAVKMEIIYQKETEIFKVEDSFDVDDYAGAAISFYNMHNELTLECGKLLSK